MELTEKWKKYLGFFCFFFSIQCHTKITVKVVSTFSKGLMLPWVLLLMTFSKKQQLGEGEQGFSFQEEFTWAVRIKGMKRMHMGLQRGLNGFAAGKDSTALRQGVCQAPDKTSVDMEGCSEWTSCQCGHAGVTLPSMGVGDMKVSFCSNNLCFGKLPPRG